MIKNVILQRETKKKNTNFNICQNSRQIKLVDWRPGKSELVRMMRNSNQFFFFTTSRARNRSNNRPWRFLNEYDIK